MIKKAPPAQEKVDSVFKQVLGLDPQQNREALVYNQIQEWDSVAHMTLVAGLEEAFDCMFCTDYKKKGTFSNLKTAGA